MSDRSAKVLFEGMLEAIDSILLYTANMDYETFNRDRKTRDAVLMQLIVLGETANRVPADLKKILPDIEWGRIIRSRNIISHESGSRLSNNLENRNRLSSRVKKINTKQKKGL